MAWAVSNARVEPNAIVITKQAPEADARHGKNRSANGRVQRGCLDVGKPATSQPSIFVI